MAIYQLKSTHMIHILCKVGKASKSGYYKWLKNRFQNNKDDSLIERIKKIQEKHSYTYGYRKMTIEINKYQTAKNNSKKIYRIMCENELLSIIRRKKKWYGRTCGDPTENILNRDFSSAIPNQKLVTDITEIKLFNRKIYLSAIMDLYNNEIVSYKIGKFNTLGLVSNTISDLINRKGELVLGGIFHSDQGFQYTNKRIQSKLKEYGIIQSMSRKGNPLDNACIENFFGIMKVEILYNKTLNYKSMQHFVRELTHWIEYYNNERIQKRLNYLSPIEYKKAM
ncbi:MAG: IS3 family transposase [Candidatus Delongbacteria bacterium]|nr:IS3 family transposase [Candidatus Delongbacteria bacterium]